MSTTNVIILILTLTFFPINGQENAAAASVVEKIALKFRDKIQAKSVVVLLAKNYDAIFNEKLFSRLSVPLISYTSVDKLMADESVFTLNSVLITLNARNEGGSLLEQMKTDAFLVEIIPIKRDYNVTLNQRKRVQKDVRLRIRFMTNTNRTVITRRKMSELDHEMSSLLNDHKVRRKLGLQKDTLTACTFHFPPFIVIDEFDGSYSGVEVQIFAAISSSLGFKYKLQPPLDGLMWGEFDEVNKTGKGLRKDVFEGKVDVGFAQIFLTRPVNKQLDVAYPYDHDGYCWFVIKPPPLSKWYGVIRPLSLTVWFFLIISILASLGFFCLFCLFHPNPEYSLGESVLILWALLLLESVPIRLKSLTLHFYIIPFLLGSMVLMTIYSSSLVSFLTIEIPQMPLDTLKDLDTRFSGQLGSMGDMDDMRKSSDEVHRRLSKRLVVYTDQTCALNEAGEGKLSIVESKTFLQYKSREMFTNKYGESRMHIMKECWNYFPISFVLPKHSPYTELFSLKIHQLNEAGLIDKWKRDEMDKVAKLAEQGNGAKLTLVRPLSIDDVQIPFMLLGISGILCIFVFLLELLWHKRAN